MEEKAIADLRGGDFDDKLLISDWDDFSLEPLFDAENETDTAYLRRLDNCGTDENGQRKILNEAPVSAENPVRNADNFEAFLLDEKVDFENFAKNNFCRNISLESDNPERISDFLKIFAGRELRIFGSRQLSSERLLGLDKNVSFGIVNEKAGKPTDRICEMLTAAARLAEELKIKGLAGREIIRSLFLFIITE